MFDSDESSLDRRIAEQQLPTGSTVARFTYWYTSRPPAYEAVVIAPDERE